MKNKNKKRGCQIKRIKSAMVGLIIKWDDPEQLEFSEHFVNCSVIHKNPVRQIHAKGIYNNFQAACPSVRMYYRFSVQLHFIGSEPVDLDDLFSFCLVSEINDYVIEQIENAVDGIGFERFTFARMEVECLSAYAPGPSIEEQLIEALEDELIISELESAA